MVEPIEPTWELDLDLRLELGARDLEISMRTRTPAVAVVGPSGAGKSTLLRVLAGVETRARGTVSVDGDVWLDTERGVHTPPWERRVGWVPQDDLLFPHLSVRQNLAYAGAGEERVAEVAALLEVTSLLGRRPRRLSGGERQRVALGRALLSRPRMLLLDEPFAALDRRLRAEVARRVRGWTADHGLPLVLVSHDEEDTSVLADERWILSGGTVTRG